jgi:hypothetical protein
MNCEREPHIKLAKKKFIWTVNALSGSRTRTNCLEGNYPTVGPTVLIPYQFWHLKNKYTTVQTYSNILDVLQLRSISPYGSDQSR